MVYVEATMRASCSVEEAFDRVTAWERHRVPLTQIQRTARGFVARTGVGPLAVDDPMRVLRQRPPRDIHLIKEGRLVHGWAIIEVAPDGGGSIVTWQEEICVSGVPDVLIAPAARWMLRRLLAQLLGHGD